MSLSGIQAFGNSRICSWRIKSDYSASDTSNLDSLLDDSWSALPEGIVYSMLYFELVLACE
jgi:hypothetical protein